jgi:hypothetical protein
LRALVAEGKDKDMSSTKTKPDGGSTEGKSNVVELAPRRIIRIPNLSKAKRPPRDLTADMITPEDPKWAWYPRIGLGSINLLGAKGGTGKGVLCANLAAHVTRGREWPLSEAMAPLGRVLWCETEDSFKQAVVPRLIANGADLNRVILKKPDEFFDLDLRSYTEAKGIKLIVLSPLNSFLDLLKDPNNGQNVRKAMETLIEDIQDTDCALIGICHTNKKADLAAVERLLGSVEYVNAARSVLLLRKEPDDDGVVRLMHGKWNYGTKADDLLFTTYNTREETNPYGQYIALEWSKPEENVEIDSAFDRQKDSSEDSESAGEWLLEYLADGSQKDTKAIFSDGEGKQHTESALKAAKKRMAGKIEHNRKWERGKLITRWWLVKA